jgi:hypothetical protein
MSLLHSNNFFPLLLLELWHFCGSRGRVVVWGQDPRISLGRKSRVVEVRWRSEMSSSGDETATRRGEGDSAATACSGAWAQRGSWHRERSHHESRGPRKNFGLYFLTYRTSWSSCWHSCFEFGRSQVQILARRPAILTEQFRDFLQSL